MRRFSQRRGLTPVKESIQIDEMDADLRNGLWNCLSVLYWERLPSQAAIISDDKELQALLTRLWLHFFKTPLDTLDSWWPTVYRQLRERFFSEDWFYAYDFLEFVVQNSAFPTLEEYCNTTLQRERSGYRFVGGILTPITNEDELNEVDRAINNARTSSSKHLQTALQLLSDRSNPDFRNSIKESISAVEAICRVLVGNEKAVLSDALKRLQRDGAVFIHPALAQSFEKLYAYTSDADGIRHSLLEDGTPLALEDAQYMLITCSAFVNYLVEKGRRSGLSNR